MTQDQYFASSEADETERSRLEILEKASDPRTIRRLEMLGVAEGWKCLEIGAGGGSIARWLAERVGPTGTVVATDINTRFLRELNLPNLEIRQHDIVNDHLEVEAYHLVHARTVLQHVAEPEKALNQMARAVRPGGWLFIEDPDFAPQLTADLTDPSAAPLVALLRTLADIMRKKGVADAYFGRRERSLMEQLRFINVDYEGWSHVNRGGGPHALLALMTFQSVAKPLIAAGVITQEQMDSVERLCRDPSFYWPGNTMFSAWGQKISGFGWDRVLQRV